MRMLSRVKLSSVGWFWFWAAALLVLPNCFLDRSGIVTPSNVNRGVFDEDDPDEPGFSSAIFCDIERPGGRRCATPEEIPDLIRRVGGAVALVAGQTSNVALDYSEMSLDTCGGLPEVVEFQGPFPRGTHICLNCGTAIGPDPETQHPNNAAVCVAECLDLFSEDDDNVPPTDAAVAFCTPERARLSTNFPASECLTDACTINGSLNADFADPRRIPEHVTWMNLDGVDLAGGGLIRVALSTGDYDAGASSGPLITSGDAYFEFIATETNLARVAGVSSGPPPVGGVSFFDIGFGILLTELGETFVVENGPAVSSFGAYEPGQKFRIKLEDRFNGTAAVHYARVVGPCTDGALCNENVFYTSENFVTYPVRVDAMFRDLGATLTEARLVRIR